jgi:L-ribulokinase
VTGIGSAIFAFLAAGAFQTIEDAQQQICPSHIIFSPEPGAQKIYHQLYDLYRRIYFDFGRPAESSRFGDVLPQLMAIARR